MFQYTRLFSAMGIVGVVLITSAHDASADTIAIPLSAFSGTEQIVEFKVATSQNLPYSEDGATFVTYTGPFARVLSVNEFLSMGGSGTLRVTFSVPASMAGFNFLNSFGSAAISAEVFADLQGLQTLGQVNLGAFAPLQSGFVGFAADSVFSRADISFAAPAMASFVIDDFRFQPIPEPGTITMTLIALGWLGRELRRQANHR